ncbi:MAG TPA: hypothetical protein VIM71_11760 [Lacunisphaera sp.]
MMAAAGLMPAWILQRGDLQATIVTTDLQKKAQLEKDGWLLDDVGQLQADAVEGSGPLYRLLRGPERLLETDAAQLPVLERAGFEVEGIVGHAAASAGPGRVAVIQFAKGEQKIWVVKDAQQKKAMQNGWSRMGVHFWLWPAAK